MTRPRLLDLFCGAGGAAMGYHRAGFEVVGVDIEPQPHYPFEFHQADALTFPLDGFDAVHASPPCQAFTVLAAIWKAGHADLLTPTRKLLQAQPAPAPWVIENVPGAPMRADIVLCGTAFGLMDGDFELWRHRWFEFGNATVPALTPPCGHKQQRYVGGVYGGGGAEPAKCKHGKQTTAAVRRRLMGIDWMTRDELAQAIPPAYTEWIGAQLLAALEAAA